LQRFYDNKMIQEFIGISFDTKDGVKGHTWVPFASATLSVLKKVTGVILI